MLKKQPRTQSQSILNQVFNLEKDRYKLFLQVAAYICNNMYELIVMGCRLCQNYAEVNYLYIMYFIYYYIMYIIYI